MISDLNDSLDIQSIAKNQKFFLLVDILALIESNSFFTKDNRVAAVMAQAFPSPGLNGIKISEKEIGAISVS